MQDKYITSKATLGYPYTNVDPKGLLVDPCVWIAARPLSPRISWRIFSLLINPFWKSIKIVKYEHFRITIIVTTAISHGHWQNKELHKYGTKGVNFWFSRNIDHLNLLPLCTRRNCTFGCIHILMKWSFIWQFFYENIVIIYRFSWLLIHNKM